MVPQQDTSPKVPKLRFREFHDEWEENKIGEIFSNIGGTALESFVNENGEYKFISIGNYSIHGKYIDNNQRILLTDKTKTKLLEKDNLVMVLNDKTSTGDMIGSSILIDEDNKYIYNQRSERLICKPEIFSKYAWFFLNSEKFRKTIVSVSQGGTQMYVNFGEIKKLHLFISNISEQQKIASFLSVVDEKIEKLKTKKSLLEKYKKGVMQKIFLREIRFRNESGDEFGKWEEKKLGEIGEIITGKTPSTSDESLWQGDIQFVTPTDISGFKYQTKTQRTVTRNLKMKILPPKSIMFTCIASIGKMSLSMNPCITNQQINSIIPYLDFDKEFIYYAILHISEYIKSTQSSNTLPIINKTEFSKFIIHVPEILEQQKIASFLSEIDKKIDTINIEIESTEKWKKGLLQGMFI